MTQPTYLIKNRRRKKKEQQIIQSPRLHTRYDEINRPTGQTILGLGRVVEGTGKYDKRLVGIRPLAYYLTNNKGQRLWDPESCALSRYPVRASGTETKGNTVAAPPTPAGLKSVVRRIRPQEAEIIDAIDAEIEELQRQITEIRNRRVEAVSVAWDKGHVVRLQDVLPQGSQTSREVEG